MYVWRFLKLANLSKLIFCKFFQKKKNWQVLYACMCVCVCVCVCVWIIKVGRLNTLIFGRMHL